MGLPMPSSFAFIEWRMFPTVTAIATCAAFWGRRYMATVELEPTAVDVPWPVAIALTDLGVVDMKFTRSTILELSTLHGRVYRKLKL